MTRPAKLKTNRRAKRSKLPVYIPNKNEPKTTIPTRSRRYVSVFYIRVARYPRQTVLMQSNCDFVRSCIKSEVKLTDARFSPLFFRLLCVCAWMCVLLEEKKWSLSIEERSLEAFSRLNYLTGRVVSVRRASSRRRTNAAGLQISAGRLPVSCWWTIVCRQWVYHAPIVAVSLYLPSELALPSIQIISSQSERACVYVCACVVVNLPSLKSTADSKLINSDTAHPLK